MLAKAFGLASSPASPEGTSNCLMTIWTGWDFPLWILAQSLCVLALQVFWDELGATVGVAANLSSKGMSPFG